MRPEKLLRGQDLQSTSFMFEWEGDGFVKKRSCTEKPVCVLLRSQNRCSAFWSWGNTKRKRELGVVKVQPLSIGVCCAKWQAGSIRLLFHADICWPFRGKAHVKYFICGVRRMFLHGTDEKLFLFYQVAHLSDILCPQWVMSRTGREGRIVNK